MPQNMKKAKISMRWLSHGLQSLPVQVFDAPLLNRGGAISCAIVAPSFPDAAERPWAVER